MGAVAAIVAARALLGMIFAFCKIKFLTQTIEAES